MTAVVLQALVLAWVRWFALLMVQPLLRVGLGARAWSVAAVFAAVLAGGDAAGVVPTMVPLGTTPLVFALVAELLLGAILGVCLSLGAHAVLGAATVPGASLRVPLAPWTLLVTSLVLAAALELGLHHAAWHASAALRETFVLGAPQSWWAQADAVAARLPTWLAGMTVLGLALATPSLLVAAACELGAAAIARGPQAAPAFAQAAVSSVRLGAVLVALGASWAIDLPRWAAAALPTVDAGVDRLATMQPAAP